MIDHLLGRPSTKLKRFQIFSVIFFWLWFLATGKRDGPHPLIRRLSQKFNRFSPWQIVVFSSVGIYAIRHLDSLLGFGAPEPLARMYSRNFYRTTWIVTALDAGFATAMHIRPKWLRDLMSLIFSAYYLVYANEADEKLRKYRAFCTVQMMRTTWEKTTNPYIRAVTWFHRPSLPIARPLLIPRPSIGAHHTRPSKAWLFYAKNERQLRTEEELVLDFCGGGYICMNPQHHEERLRQLAKQMQKPVLAVDYCKAPEYPYPFALEECFDLYRTLHETAGKVIGMSGSPNFRIILSGDSAGGNLATGVVLKIIEYPQTRIQMAYAAQSTSSSSPAAAASALGSASKDVRRPPPLPKPIGVLLSYPSLNFGFSSWMKPEHLRLLRQQSEVNLDNLAQQGSLTTASSSSSIRSQRRRSAVNLAARGQQDRRRSSEAKRAKSKERSRDPRSYHSLTETAELHLDERARYAEVESTSDENSGGTSGYNSDSPYDRIWAESTLTPSWEKSGLPWGQVQRQAQLDQIADREERRAQAKFEKEQKALQEAAQAADARNRDQKRGPFNTRLTVTSMAGYFQDRIISQGMLRAMAILYIGPKRQPDLDHDYFLSPVVAPAHLLAEFPPVLFICGEKDPLCDDTVVMAGRIREAKLAKKAEMERRRAVASARFGEGLRTTPISTPSIPVDPIESETAEDWVQMRIIEGWSHGFLQMSSLMPEAKQVIAFLGTWMSLVFEEYSDKLFEEQEQAELQAQTRAQQDAQRRAGPHAVASPSKLRPTSSASAAPAADVPIRNMPSGSNEPIQTTSSLKPQTATSAAAKGNAARLESGNAARIDINSAVAANGRSTGSLHPGTNVAQDHDADDEDDDEDDGALMVIPKGGRRLSSNRAFSPASGSPRLGTVGSGGVNPSSTTANGGSPARKLRDLAGSPVPAQIELLRAETREMSGDISGSVGVSGGRSGAARVASGASMSDSEAPRGRVASSGSTSVPGRADSDTHLSRPALQQSTGASTSSTPRRSSKNGPTQLDQKYRAMLVEETSLLARRRDDVLFGLENNTTVVNSDDDDDLLAKNAAGSAFTKYGSETMDSVVSRGTLASETDDAEDGTSTAAVDANRPPGIPTHIPSAATASTTPTTTKVGSGA